MDKRLLVSLAIAVVAAIGVASAAKPPKPQNLGASTTFRCYSDDAPSSGACELPVSDGTDRIRDDGTPYPSTTGTVWTSGFYSFKLQLPGRGLNLRLGTPSSGSRPCETASNCNPDYSIVVGDGVYPVLLDNVSIEVKPVNGSTDLPGLLWGMKCGNPTDAIVHYTFWLSSGTGGGHWGFNFDNRSYGGTNAEITRNGNLTWTVVSKMNSVGELLSWGHSGLLRPQTGPSHEGLYDANFKFTIDAPIGTPVSVCVP